MEISNISPRNKQKSPRTPTTTSKRPGSTKRYSASKRFSASRRKKKVKQEKREKSVSKSQSQSQSNSGSYSRSKGNIDLISKLDNNNSDWYNLAEDAENTDERWKCMQKLMQIVCNGKNAKNIPTRFIYKFSYSVSKTRTILNYFGKWLNEEEHILCRQYILRILIPFGKSYLIEKKCADKIVYGIMIKQWKETKTTITRYSTLAAISLYYGTTSMNPLNKWKKWIITSCKSQHVKQRIEAWNFLSQIALFAAYYDDPALSNNKSSIQTFKDLNAKQKSLNDVSSIVKDENIIQLIKYSIFQEKSKKVVLNCAKFVFAARCLLSDKVQTLNILYNEIIDNNKSKTLFKKIKISDYANKLRIKKNHFDTMDELNLDSSNDSDAYSNDSDAHSNDSDANSNDSYDTDNKSKKRSSSKRRRSKRARKSRKSFKKMKKKCNKCSSKNFKARKVSSKVDKLTDEVEDLKDIIIDLRDDKNDYEEELIELRSECTVKEKKINLLKDEMKEIEIEIFNLKQHIYDFKKKEKLLIKMNENVIKQNIDLLNWDKWNVDDILEWILSIDNGKYINYKNDLIQNLPIENIRGYELPQINVDDLQEFGIKDINHREELMQQIQKLTLDNNNNNRNHHEKPPPMAYDSGLGFMPGSDSGSNIVNHHEHVVDQKEGI